MGDAGVWREMWSVLSAANPTAALTSSYREGSITATGNLSYHARGMAIDVSGPNMMGYFEWIVAHYPNSREIIYSPAGSRQIHNGEPHLYGQPTKGDHYDHVHWATTSLADGGAGGTPPATGDNEDSPWIPNEIEPLVDFYNLVSDPGTWRRVGLFLGGAVLILISVFALTKKVSL